jgi:hypothetical protein
VASHRGGQSPSRRFASPILATAPATCAGLELPLTPRSTSPAVAPRVHGQAETGRSVSVPCRPTSLNTPELGLHAEHLDEPCRRCASCEPTVLGPPLSDRCAAAAVVLCTQPEPEPETPILSHPGQPLTRRSSCFSSFDSARTASLLWARAGDVRSAAPERSVHRRCRGAVHIACR